MPKLAVFDAEYEMKRNWFIPQAEAHADSLITLPNKPTDYEVREWNLIYLSKMDELARNAGLVN
jgi:hypothetical protein